MTRRDLMIWAAWIAVILMLGSLAYAVYNPIELFGVRVPEWAVVWPGALVIPPPHIAVRLLRIGRGL